jgi:Arc/MetJ-type ribon-helix-helix transcriptional regulator
MSLSSILKPTSNKNTMTIHLTPEQERRVQAVISRGAYESVEEVVDAALAAGEQRTVPGFAGTQEELDSCSTHSGYWQRCGGTTKIRRDKPPKRA